MSELAIKGGEPVRKRPFPPSRTIGEEEKKAVNRVLNSGELSKFLGSWSRNFYGGPEVRALEEEWAAHFSVKNAVAVNSCTSGLYCAVGAAGVEPGEEIIVSPYTMAASATAPLIFNAVPVFADIEEDYFCLDPGSVEERVTPRTRAIIIVDLFGLPYNVEAINAIAEKHGLLVIEDCAQAPGALSRGRFAGTLGDIGVYSLNYHKHIHCGEGGIVVTDDDQLAEKVRLIRNHAEAVVEAKGVTDLTNLIGFNFRMTEIEAAIARCQLKKLDGLVKARQDNCGYLSERLGKIPGIIPPAVREGCTHAYYLYCGKIKEEIAGVSRERFIEAVQAELAPAGLGEDEVAPVVCGYVKPLYLQPLFQKQIAYGTRGCPFKAPWYDGQVNYDKGLSPVAERMFEKELFFLHDIVHPGKTRNDLDDVAGAFEKVWEQRKQL